MLPLYCTNLPSLLHASWEKGFLFQLKSRARRFFDNSEWIIAISNSFREEREEVCKSILDLSKYFRHFQILLIQKYLLHCHPVCATVSLLHNLLAPLLGCSSVRPLMELTCCSTVSLVNCLQFAPLSACYIISMLHCQPACSSVSLQHCQPAPLSVFYQDAPLSLSLLQYLFASLSTSLLHYQPACSNFSMVHYQFAILSACSTHQFTILSACSTITKLH